MIHLQPDPGVNIVSCLGEVGAHPLVDHGLGERVWMGKSHISSEIINLY